HCGPRRRRRRHPARRDRARPGRRRGRAGAVPRPARPRRRARNRFAGRRPRCVGWTLVDIRDLTADDLDAVLDLRKRAFGPLSASNVATFRKMAQPTLDAGRHIGVDDRRRLAAAARLRPFPQWWHGRPQPMSGVAGATVSPEDRGRGLGRLLMHAVIERAAALGDAVSALFPATTPIYRSVGYEHAGAQHITTLPAEALR